MVGGRLQVALHVIAQRVGMHAALQTEHAGGHHQSVHIDAGLPQAQGAGQLRRAVGRAEIQGQGAAGRIAGHTDALGVQTVFGAMVADPIEHGHRIGQLGGEAHRRHKTVVGVHHGKSLTGEQHVTAFVVFLVAVI